MHARSGGNIEVMGDIVGKAIGDTVYILDSYALPVDATETRVHTQEETYSYQVAFSELSAEVGRMDTVVGWYHSHPGYGPWLSGIDVQTQMLQQMVGPAVAIVVCTIQILHFKRNQNQTKRSIFALLVLISQCTLSHLSSAV
jgi:COP9 signalosome complex subunit 5